MNIKIIKTVGLYVVAGIATAAGAALWNNVLQNKIDFAIEKHKNRKNNKVIKFNKNQKNNGEMNNGEMNNGEMNMGKVIIFNKNQKNNGEMNNGEMNMGKVIIFNKNWSR